MSTKKGFTLISTGIFILLFAGIILSWFHQIGCEGQLFNDNLPPTPSQQILSDRLIGQSFVASRDGLSRIDLFFQTYGRYNNRDVSLALLELPPNVIDPSQGIKVFETMFNSSITKDRTWHTFTFSELSSSADKNYLITLQSSESEEGNAITIGGIQQNVYVSGMAIVYAPDLGFSQVTPVNGDMMFRACYEMTLLEKLQALIKQITQNRPALWGNRSFYIFSLSLYVVLLISLFLTFFRQIS